MGNYTREEILQMAEEEDVEFIRLQFTDMFGTLKNIAITARELPRALDNRCIVDGSFIAGIAGESEPDMYLRPDLDTFAILPWRPQQGKVARLLCDIYCPDGTPHERSPRYILKKTAREAKKEGYTCLVDPECEFFLFHTDDNGVPTTVTHEKAGYLDVSPVDLGENARRDIVLNLEDMGIEVESSHHETAPAQHEVDFKYGEVRTIADRIMSFKMTVRTIAKRHGLHATFMPKPRAEVNGSGMHIHFSLFKDGRNVFVNPGNPQELSEEAYYFVGGLLAHSKEMALITNPMVEMVQKDFLPSVFAYIDKVAATAVAKKSVVSDVSTASEGKLIKELSQLADEISTGLETLKADTAKALATEDPLANAKAYQTVVLSDMDELRKSVDAAETLIPDALLPYPTYDKLLFSV